MTAIPVNYTSRAAGADLTGAAWTTVTTADTFPPGPNNYLRVRSTNTVVCTVTVMTASDSPGPAGTYVAPLVLLPAVQATTGDRLYGPFPANPFASQADGQVHVTYTTTTQVFAQCLNFG